MKPYDLVIADSLQQLIETTNEAVAHGYIPVGSLACIEGKFIQPILLITSKTKINGSTSKKQSGKKAEKQIANQRVHWDFEDSPDF